jgi:hypothetical protein
MLKASIINESVWTWFPVVLNERYDIQLDKGQTKFLLFRNNTNGHLANIQNKKGNAVRYNWIQWPMEKTKSDYTTDKNVMDFMSTDQYKVIKWIDTARRRRLWPCLL